MKRLKQKVREGTEQKDEVLVVTHLFALQEDLHQVDRRRLTAEVETSTIRLRLETLHWEPRITTSNPKPSKSRLTAIYVVSGYGACPQRDSTAETVAIHVTASAR